MYGLIDKRNDISLKYNSNVLHIIVTGYLDKLIDEIKILEIANTTISMDKLNKYFENLYIVDYINNIGNEITLNKYIYDFLLKKIVGLDDIFLTTTVLERNNKLVQILNKISKTTKLPPNVVIKNEIDEQLISEKKEKIKDLEIKLDNINKDTIDDLCNINFRKHEIERLEDINKEKRRIFEADINIFKQLFDNNIIPPEIFKQKYDILHFMKTENLLNEHDAFEIFNSLYDKIDNMDDIDKVDISDDDNEMDEIDKTDITNHTNHTNDSNQLELNCKLNDILEKIENINI